MHTYCLSEEGLATTIDGYKVQRVTCVAKWRF